MSNTSSDLLQSLADCEFSSCDHSDLNNDTEEEETSRKNNSESKSQPLKEDRFEHCVHLLRESEQALINRNALISLLQEQLMKMEELHQRMLEKQMELRFRFSTNNMNPLYHKSTEGSSITTIRKSEPAKRKSEHKLPVKIFENSPCQNKFLLYFRSTGDSLIQCNKKLDTIFEKGNQHEYEEMKTLSDEKTSNSSNLSLVDSKRSLSGIRIKSVRSKIETEFFQECQINFEAPDHINKEVNVQISERFCAHKDIDSFHQSEISQNKNKCDETESYFEQVQQDESALEKDLCSQKIECLQRNKKRFGRNEGHENDPESCNEVQRNNKEMLTQKLIGDERTKHETIMTEENELRLLKEQLFHKECVINAQQKKMKRLEGKLEETYHELIKTVIKNKTESRSDVPNVDYRRAQKEILHSEYKAEKAYKFQREEIKQSEKIARSFMEAKAEKMINANSKYAREEELWKDAVNDELIFHINELKSIKNDGRNYESEQCLVTEEVKSQVALAIKRKHDVDLLQIKIKQVASELENANKEITECVEQNKALLEDYEVKLELVQNQYQLVKEENDLLKKTIKNGKNWKDAYNVMAETNEKLEAKICQRNEHLTRLEHELERFVSQEKELEDISNNLDESRKNVVLKDNLLMELRENLNEVVNLKEISESKLLENDKTIEILNRNFERIAEELDNTNQERTQFIQDVQKSFGEYDLKLATLSDECENAQKKILQFKQNENALNLQLTIAQADSDQLKRAYDELNMQKQAMEEEQNEIKNQRECGNDEQYLEHQIKSLCDIVAQQNEQLELSNEERLNLVNEIKKLEFELETKTTILKQREFNSQMKIVLLVKELDDTETYVNKNKKLFSKYENEIRLLNDDCQNLSNEIRRLKRREKSKIFEVNQNLDNKMALLTERLKERDTRVIQLEDDKENLKSQMKKLIFDYENRLTFPNHQREEYENIKEEKENLSNQLISLMSENLAVKSETKSKIDGQDAGGIEMLNLHTNILLQREEEINKLKTKILKMEIQLEAIEKEKRRLINHYEEILNDREKMRRRAGSDVNEKSSECSIPMIKEESALEAYEELIIEKENLEDELKEMNKLFENERKSKMEAENELFRFRENEKTMNDKLMKILPEFLGQDDTETKTLEPTKPTYLSGDGIESSDKNCPDLRTRLSLLSKELESTKKEKWELIKKGKEIFYHYEASISKLKSDYEHTQHEIFRIRSKQSDEENWIFKQKDAEELRGFNKEKNTEIKREYEVTLNKITARYKSIKEEAQQLKESQETYCKKLTSCLKELAIYKDDVKNWMDAYDKIIGEKSDLETEMKILLNNVLHKDEVIKEMRNKLCEAEEQLENVVKENAAFASQKEQIISDCEIKYKNMTVKYEEQLKRSKDEMNQKIIMKDNVIHQHEEQLDFGKNENVQLDEHITILKEKLSTLEKNMNSKEKQFNSQIEENKRTLLDATQNYEKLKIQYDYLLESKYELNQKIIMKDEVIHHYEDELNIEKNENAQLNERIAILKEKLSMLEKDMTSKEKQFNTKMQENKTTLLEVSQNYEKLKLEYDYLLEDVKFHKTKNLNLIHEIEDRDVTIKSLKNEIEELEKELYDVRAEMKLHNVSASLNMGELQLACAELEKKLELTKYALKKQECQVVIKADDDFKELQSRIDALKDNNNFLKEKLDSKDEEILRLSEKVERTQKEKTELNLHMVNTIRELKGEIYEIKFNNHIFREQIIDRSQQLLQQKQQEEESECVILKQQLQEANVQKMNLEVDVRKFREMLHTVQDQCAHMKEKNKGLQADISAMEKELLVNKSWKTKNAELQEKLDNIESELLAVKHQCTEVHEQLKTTKMKLAETQEELTSTKVDLANATSSISGYKVEIGNEKEYNRNQFMADATKEVSRIPQDVDTRNTCLNAINDLNLLNTEKLITVLYNNTRYAESKSESAGSTLSNVMLLKESKVQERLAHLNQMEKEVEEMISAVQQQNRKLKNCHCARLKNENDFDTRLQEIRQRSDNLETEFNNFQTKIGQRITTAVSIRRQFENN